GVTNHAKPRSMVSPRAFSSARRSGSMPLRRSINVDFPWSTWPAVETTRIVPRIFAYLSKRLWAEQPLPRLAGTVTPRDEDSLSRRREAMRWGGIGEVNRERLKCVESLLGAESVWTHD